MFRDRIGARGQDRPGGLSTMEEAVDLALVLRAVPSPLPLRILEGAHRRSLAGSGLHRPGVDWQASSGILLVILWSWTLYYWVAGVAGRCRAGGCTSSGHWGGWAAIGAPSPFGDRGLHPFSGDGAWMPTCSSSNESAEELDNWATYTERRGRGLRACPSAIVGLQHHHPPHRPHPSSSSERAPVEGIRR